MLRHAAVLTFAVLAAAAPVRAAERVVLPQGVVPSHYDLTIAPDAAHMSFTGAVAIALDVKAPTRTITLNSVDLAFGNVALSGMAQAPQVTFDKAKETATLSFAGAVSAGPHVLTIAYTGKINQQAAGLFALDYDGGKKRALYTQFENSDARRFLPCWDEPGLKATFTLTATVPAGQMAISNMPIARSTVAGGGMKTVAFAPSPKMSSYLLFFGLGDFERVHRDVGGVDVGVITTAGKSAQGAYALEAEAHLLPYYEQYFGVKFPLPKLDIIAAPGESQFFGAMENWGAMFFFERDVLFDPRISTENDKRSVYIVVAHETAHQWFGDLVTMAWWDDLWLNEGFAEWMETKASDQFHPEWKLSFDAMGQKESALIVDSRTGTHPIIQPIADVLQANEAFDTITYEKGQAVIWMLQDFVGAEPFRNGVAAYIKAHAYGPAVTDALWQALGQASPVPVGEIAHDFTLQAGVPLITVDATANGIRLSQSRFVADASGRTPATWHVPVIEKPLGARGVWRGIVGTTAVDIPLDKGAVPVVNAGQTGYFRTLYAPTLFRQVAAHFHALDAADQLGIVNDARALGYAGYQPLSDFLDIAAQATPDMDAPVLSGIATDLGQLADVYRGLPGEAAFDHFGQRVLDPIFAKLGWEPKPGESQNVILLRAALLDVLSALNDPAVIAEANRRFAGYVTSPSSLSGDLRINVLQIAAAHATPAIWEQLHVLAKRATSSLERSQLYAMLALARDPKLAQQALDLTLTNEVEVTTRPTIIRYAAGYRPELAFAFTLKHLDLINSWVEPDSRNGFVPRLAENSYDPAMIGALKAFADAHIPATARQSAVKAEGTIAYYAAIRQKRLPAVARWLAQRAH